MAPAGPELSSSELARFSARDAAPLTIATAVADAFTIPREETPSARGDRDTPPGPVPLSVLHLILRV